jgi:Cu/Ag efflux protein CusF
VKKAIVIIVAVLFTFALASVSFSLEKKAEMAKPSEKPQIHYIFGKVKAVDTSAQTLTIAKQEKDKEEDTVVTINKETIITIDKEKKMLSDVKVGEMVAVMYTKLEGKNIAKNIVIRHSER